MRPFDLRCEGAVSPIQVASSAPHLSWRLTTDSRGDRQTAYRILAASSPELLAVGAADMWDSGRISSDRTFGITYGGRSPAVGSPLFWSVAVWDTRGAMARSAPARWERSAGGEDFQSARWIGPSAALAAKLPSLYAAETVRLDEAEWMWGQDGPSTTLQRHWSLPCGHPHSARFALAATGCAELWVNGRLAGRTAQARQFEAFDVRNLLAVGDNQLAVRATCGEGGAVAGRLAVVCVHGDAFVLPLDATWTDRACHAAHRVAHWGETAGFYAKQPGATERVMPAIRMRREFSLPAAPVRARAYVSGLGYYRLYANGRRVGDLWQDPPVSNYRRRVYYRVLDLTAHLAAGPNAVGLELAAGRFFPPRIVIPTATRVYGHPRALMRVVAELADGSWVSVVTDRSWTASVDGPLDAVSEYDGERFDGRRDDEGYDRPGFHGRDFEPVDLADPPGGVLVSAEAQPMRVTEVIEPAAVVPFGDEGTLYDFGEHIYGAEEAWASGPAGTRVVIAFGMRLDGSRRLDTADQRSAQNTDQWILRGSEDGSPEPLTPHFSARGFRYAWVSGVPSERVRMRALRVRADLEAVGTFQASDALLTRIHENVRRGQMGVLRSVPMETDRDERQGWLGDPAKGAEASAYNFDVSRLYRQWLADIRAEQRPDGSLPDGAPANFQHWYSDDVVWPSVITIVSTWAHRFYGDRRFLSDNYGAARRWFLHLHERWAHPDGTIDRATYGDWCDAVGGGDRGGTDPALIATAYHCLNAGLLASMAQELGLTGDAARFRELRAQIRRGYLSRFASGSQPHPRPDRRTQCALALPLAFDMLGAEARAAWVDRLRRDIAARGNHLSVGLVGMQWIMRVLARSGLREEAYRIATNRTAPGWGYMVERGATTIWERWNGDTAPPGMNSLNLLILAGNLTSWLYEDVAGLRYDPAVPGGQHVLMNPAPLGDLTWAEASHRSVHGWSRLAWRADTDELAVEASVPANCRATLTLPASGAAAVSESEAPVAASRGVRLLGTGSSTIRLRLEAGDYRFSVRTRG